MSPSLLTIAIIDDEAKMRQAFTRLLRLHDYEVLPFETGDEFLNRSDLGPIACVLLDLHLPGEFDGIGVLEVMRQRGGQPAVIMITAHDMPGIDQRAKALGASDYLLKPVDEESLLRAISSATGHLAPSHRAPSLNEGSIDAFPEIGEEPSRSS